MRTPAPIPSRARFLLSAASAAGARSTNSTLAAPLLSASIPTAPDPAYKSRKRAPSMRSASTLNSVSRSRSLVGRVAIPAGPSSGRERNLPAMMRIGSSAYIAPARYNRTMRGWSIPLGRWMGVELRVHAFFPLLALVCLALGATDGMGRGFGLFAVLVAAVLVRETARLIVAAWLGLRLRAVLLLPIGGLFAYANPESQEGAGQGSTQFILAFTGDR